MTIEKPARQPWSSRVVTVLAVATALALFLGALLTYDFSTLDTFGRLVAQFLLQVAVVVLGGAIIKFLMDENVKRRDAAEKKRAEEDIEAEKKRSEHAVRMSLDQAKRTEFLQRIRAKHVQISYAQVLIVAHNSGRTYTEQLRQLMLIAPELEDLAEDLKAGTDLFEPSQAAEIIKGVEQIVSFLGRGSIEYVRCHSFVDEDAKRKEKLSNTIARKEMAWVAEVIRSFPSMPQDYVAALNRSKGKLRGIVYASSGGTLSDSDSMGPPPVRAEVIE